MNNNLQIIYGPMFSGKTTKLIDIYEDTVSKFGKESCLAINYALDNRYGENKIISHDKKSIECARGLSSFTSEEITKIMGHHSNEIEKLLGYVSKSEVIHKDDMVEV